MIGKIWGRTILGAALALAAAATPAASVEPVNEPWDDAARARFYSGYQGSKIMPLKWMRALPGPDGRKFMADGLARYGYLPNPYNSELPIGFTKSPDGHIGMTCAACHTRRITANGFPDRIIDGGPALVDFQRFIIDLNVHVRDVATDQQAFNAFAREVLQEQAADPKQVAKLRQDVQIWSFRYGTLISGSQKDAGAWGVGRADAIQMIFNRLTGLGLAPDPTRVLANNIVSANAPVRYPYLWNAHNERITQWMGFMRNTTEGWALLRNLGQVYGVFAEFHPKKRLLGLGRDYWAINSADIRGLRGLEKGMKKIKPPEWTFGGLKGDPKGIGRAAFVQACAGCHERTGAGGAWDTRVYRIEDLKTDRLQIISSARTARSGTMQGELGLGETEPALKILQTTVALSALDYYRPFGAGSKSLIEDGRPSDLIASNKRDLAKLEDIKGYEARWLKGVWAAAPYLHNGSVPTLADLLKPASQRPPTFLVGTEFDPEKVGLSERQTGVYSEMRTTGCEAPQSGNSRCGHEYGVDLSAEQKVFLLNYLKTY